MKELKILYFFTFVLGAALIVPTHIFPQPYFMHARFPHYLEMMDPFLGIAWPMTFEIYHYTLYTLIIIGSVNVLGIIFYPKFKQIAIASSIIGVFLISIMILFFFLVFININMSTAVIYGLYSITLLIVNWLTFKALTRKKEA